MQTLSKIISQFPAAQALDIALRAKPYMYNGLRKLVVSVGYTSREWPIVSLEDLGYTNAKLTSLERMYYNAESVERARALLKKREDQAFSPVSVSMHGGEKRANSLGWCMNSLVVTQTPKTTRVELLYRSTEIIRKFTADLVFLPKIFERLEIKPDEYSFHFSNAFISGVFYPTLFQWVDPIAYLTELQSHEPEFYHVSTKFIRRSVRGKDQVFPYSPENNQHRMAWARIPEHMKNLHQYFKDTQ